MRSHLEKSTPENTAVMTPKQTKPLKAFPAKSIRLAWVNVSGCVSNRLGGNPWRCRHSGPHRSR
eukprot:4165919-Pyramimonas_sp.AAC.1